MDHCSMIMIVSGYTFSRKTYMEKLDRSEWVTTSFCMNQRGFSLKEDFPDLRYFIVICDVIVFI